jgi:anti-sigma regulatory factor (Ser/Thr protein kinase)
MHETLQVEPRLECIEEVRQRFERFAESESLDRSLIRGVLMALDELLNNIISYGFKGDERGTIDIEWTTDSDGLRITVMDRGVAFNPLRNAPPDVSLPVETRELGGLGIHLIREMMDEVSYERRGDMNILTIRKSK